MRVTEKRHFSILWLLPVILLVLFAGGIFYVNDYYHADPSALAVLSENIPGVSVSNFSDRIIFRPENQQPA